jgi:lactoylglutathione lyase
MNKLRKIDCIMYRVKDLDVSAKFYLEILGLKQVWRDDEGQMVGLSFPENNSEIVIHTREDIPNPDFCYSVDNVEEFVKEFKAQGYKVCKEPFEVRTGKFAVLADPDGNIVNVIDLTAFGGKPKYD